MSADRQGRLETAVQLGAAIKRVLTTLREAGSISDYACLKRRPAKYQWVFAGTRMSASGYGFDQVLRMLEDMGDEDALLSMGIMDDVRLLRESE